MDTLVNNREDFEKWLVSKIGDPDQYVLPRWIACEAWQEATTRQQKIIDDLQLKLAIKDDMITALNLTIDTLKALNPDVPCPVCDGRGKSTDHDRCYPPNFYDCELCDGKTTVSTVKALQYEIEQLKQQIISMQKSIDKMQKALGGVV